VNIKHPIMNKIVIDLFITTPSFGFIDGVIENEKSA
jgi:hypothetical protein